MPRVNFDVSFRILDFSTRGVAASLMRTCRTVNREGTKHLFRSPIVLRTNEQVVSFVQFFVARDDKLTAEYRYRFLRNLSIHLTSPSQEAAAALTFFFTRIAVPFMTNFTSLELHRPERLLSADPGLGPAISALPLLRRIKVTDAGPLCGTMLEDLHAPLVSAYLDVDWVSDIDFDPCSILHNARHTLEDLEAHWTDMFRHHGAPFPKLKRLYLNTAIPPTPHELRRVCPNLRSLNVDYSSAQQWWEMQEIRDSHAHQRSFSSLYIYSGSVNVLYMLNLRCPISRLAIYDEEAPLAIQEVVPDARPSHLTLTTDHTGASFFLDRTFVHPLAQPGFWHWPLKTLEFVINFRPYHDENVQIHKLLVCRGYLA